MDPYQPALTVLALTGFGARFRPHLFWEEFARYLAPIVLFVGGIWLLSLRIPGWSLILGLPATQIGLVLAILSFDNSAKKAMDTASFHVVKCEICGNPTAVPVKESRGICPDCKAKKPKSSS